MFMKIFIFTLILAGAFSVPLTSSRAMLMDMKKRITRNIHGVNNFCAASHWNTPLCFYDPVHGWLYLNHGSGLTFSGGYTGGYTGGNQHIKKNKKWCRKHRNDPDCRGYGSGSGSDSDSD